MPLFITFDRYSHVASLTLNAYELIIPGFDENCILKFNTETAHVSFCPKKHCWIELCTWFNQHWFVNVLSAFFDPARRTRKCSRCRVWFDHCGYAKSFLVGINFEGPLPFLFLTRERKKTLVRALTCAPKSAQVVTETETCGKMRDAINKWARCSFDDDNTRCTTLFTLLHNYKSRFNGGHNVRRKCGSHEARSVSNENGLYVY